MRPKYTLQLSDLEATLETVGGKGASLAKLSNAGLPVPSGFHVTTQAYIDFVAHNDLQSKIDAVLTSIDPTKPASLESASEKITRMFMNSDIPVAVIKAVVDRYMELPGKDPAVAVRSSATAEDLPEASFAGQQETYLNIRGSEALLEATRKCWASLWTARAIGYRARQNIGSKGVALAVVVQLLVPAEAAGILFTANPVTGHKDEMMVSASWGLGEAVVGGLVTPDTLTLQKPLVVVHQRETSHKLTQTVCMNGGTEEIPVPRNLRDLPVLDDDQAAELGHLGLQIEDLYDQPMDIEWTLADGKFAIVQARPITTLPEKPPEAPVEWSLPDPKATYARGSLAEHTPTPVTPLFATLGLRIANSETERLWSEFSIEPHKLFAGDGFYLAINNYVYGGFKLGLYGTLTMMKISMTQLGTLFKGSVERWHAGRKVFADEVASWEAKDISNFSTSELLDGARKLFRAATRYYTVIQATLPSASVSEIAFSRFYKSLVKRKSDPDFTTLLFGFETMPVRAEKSLYDLASWLKKDPSLAIYMIKTDSDEIFSDTRKAPPPEGISPDVWADWRSRFAGHFDKYGRTVYEYDFANPTPAEAPGPQIEAIKLFLTDPAANPYERHQVAVERRELATNNILARLGWPRKGWFEKLLDWAQNTGKIREDSIADMGLAHPLIRRMFKKIGEHYVTAGVFKTPDDIYWLEENELEEINSMLDMGEKVPDMMENIRDRKADWDASLQITPPVALPEKAWILKLIGGGDPEEKDGKLTLKGLGTSTGTVTAPACVLNGPEDFSKMKAGDVLIATTTTPAWTPLFTMAAAVVTDIGGPLSHSSIVAREYGIPAVMAARNATRFIKSGQMITVNGADGTVVIEE